MVLTCSDPAGSVRDKENRCARSNSSAHATSRPRHGARHGLGVRTLGARRRDRPRSQPELDRRPWHGQLADGAAACLGRFVDPRRRRPPGRLLRVAPEWRYEQHLAAVPDRVHHAERDRGRRDLDDQDRGGRDGPHRRLPDRDAADLLVRRPELRQHGLPRRSRSPRRRPWRMEPRRRSTSSSTPRAPRVARTTATATPRRSTTRSRSRNNGDANGDFNLAQASLTVADDQALQKNRNPQRRPSRSTPARSERRSVTARR